MPEACPDVLGPIKFNMSFSAYSMHRNHRPLIHHLFISLIILGAPTVLIITSDKAISRAANTNGVSASIERQPRVTAYRSAGRKHKVRVIGAATTNDLASKGARSVMPSPTISHQTDICFVILYIQRSDWEENYAQRSSPHNNCSTRQCHSSSSDWLDGNGLSAFRYQ